MMEAVRYPARDQKVRFLACEILFKGLPQTLEDVCSDCLLFSVTEAELREFTSVPVNFGKCLKTALFESSPGKIYVTPEFCREIGGNSVVTQWLRKVSQVEPAVPVFEKSDTPSKQMIDETSRCEARNGAIPVLSIPGLGERHVSQCPSVGERALTHAGITDRDVCMQSSASHWPINDGAALSQVPKVDKPHFFASPARGSTEFSMCPSTCESVSSQGPTKNGLMQQGDGLCKEGSMVELVIEMSSARRVQETGEGARSLSPLVAGKRDVLTRGKRSKVAQKLELITEASKVVVEGRIAHESGVSSRVTRSATANLPRNELATHEKEREREPYVHVGDNETPGKRKRGKAKGVMIPVAVEEEPKEDNFQSLAGPGIHIVSLPDLGGFDCSEVVDEKRISLSATEKSSIVDPIQAIVPTTEAEAPRKRSKRSGSSSAKSSKKPSTKNAGTKAVTTSPFPLVSSSAPGATCCQYVQVPVVLDLEVRGGPRVSSGFEKSVGEELENEGSAINTEQELAENISKHPTCRDSYDREDAVTPCRNETLTTPEKSPGTLRAELLYVSDSEQDSLTAGLPSVDTKVHTSLLMHPNPNGAHDGSPKLSATLPGAGKGSLDTEMMQLQTVNVNSVKSLEDEEGIGTELVFRTGSRQHLTGISDGLREMYTIMASSPAELVEGRVSSRRTSLADEKLKCNLSEVQVCASLPRAEFPGDAPVDQNVGGVSGSGYSFVNGNGQELVGQMEKCAKPHMSVDIECAHRDGFAAFTTSPGVKVGQFHSFCNRGKGTIHSADPRDEIMERNGFSFCNREGIISGAEPGDETMERNGPFHAGAISSCLNSREQTPGARGLTSLKYAHQLRGGSCPAKKIKDVDKESVCGDETETSSRLTLVTAPAGQADRAMILSECRGLAIEETSNLSSIKIDSTLSHEAPSTGAKGLLDGKYAELSGAAEVVGSSSTVSQSLVSTKGSLAGACNLNVEDFRSRKVVFDGDQLRGRGRTEVQAVLSATSQKETAAVCPVARRGHTALFASAEKTAVASKRKHVKTNYEDGSPVVKGKVRFVSIEPSQVGVGEVTHVKQTLGESFGSGHLWGRSETLRGMSFVGDSVHVQLEDSAYRSPEGILKDAPIKALECTKRSSAAGNEFLALELGPVMDVTIDDKRDGSSKRTHPDNKPGTFVSKNSGELISIERLAVQDAIVPASVKVTDPLPTQKNREFKIVPEFDDYTVIGEEGSGGYGTVYRVMNNHTKRIYAMKCPLLKTSESCVENEISMLQQLGGKECIIKFETVVPGRFRTFSGSGEKMFECKSILLEFMEHDKPEILKKEITVEELRTYCVCLFRALAHMHKLGIMHLDIKPGNFLFSRSKKRGYLVDFNLATDEQKPKRMKKVLPSSSHIIRRTDSSSRFSTRPPVQDVASTPVSYSKRSRLLMGASGTHLSYGTPSPAKTLSVLQDHSNRSVSRVSADTKVSSPRLPDLAPSRSTTPMGALSSPRISVKSPKPANEHRDSGARQRCEGSADIQKKNALGPRPQSGHRALLMYIDTNIYNQQSPVFCQQQTSLPASQRKRVAATQNKKKNIAAGSIPGIERASQPSIVRRLKAPTKLKGYNDEVKNGPGVGTRGYRAPEILLRSLKQTTKVDVWSAGVSLLQLVSGRSPFPSASTDGALKDIAKVRGSDKVLALATSHERGHVISQDLRARRYTPVALKEWCERHSRRPDLKGTIPPELFDLIEKCLDVDPVSRISAEEALNHQFCSPLQDWIL